MFNKVRRVMNAIFILLLLFLLTLPRVYLSDFCDGMLEKCLAAERAEDPGEALFGMRLLYEKNSPVLRLFLDHTAVDAVGAGVAAAVPLRDREALYSALSAIRSALDSLRRVESGGVAGLF